MNDYFRQCHLLVISGWKSGLNDTIVDDENTRQRIAAITDTLGISISFHAAPEELTRLNWPVEGISVHGPFDFPATSYHEAFQLGYRKVVGLFALPDGLSEAHIEEAFLSIRPLDFCIGPDNGGGLYLLGMNMFDDTVFLNRDWGSQGFYKQITRCIGIQKKVLYKLPVL